MKLISRLLLEESSVAEVEEDVVIHVDGDGDVENKGGVSKSIYRFIALQTFGGIFCK